MTYVTTYQSNLTQGELSPWLYGRVDIAQYDNSCRVLKNFIVRPQGGVIKRPGTKYVASIKTQSDGETRLIPFIYSDSDAYVIEAGNQYFRFYRNNAQILSGGSPYEISTPWTSAQLANVKFAQVYDSIYFVHPDVKPRKLTRTSDTSWTMTEVDFNDGPYFDLIDEQWGGRGTNYTMTPSATSGSITMTSSSAIFASTDVGRIIRWRGNSSVAWGWGIITAYTSSTVVTVSVQSPLSATTASTQWRLGSFSDTTGWPSCITFFEQRMVLANTRSQQQTIWFSTSADITDFSPDNAEDKDQVDASTAMTYTIADNKANVIYWIEPSKGLYIGTSGGVWLARSSNQGEALTPSTITINAIIKDSSANVPAVTAGSTLMYPQKFRRKLLEVGYSFEDDAYRAADLAILAEHRTAGYIDEIEVARNPNYLVWVRMIDGTVSALTYIREQNVIAWTRQEFGGTDVEVDSMAVIPGSAEDELWMIIKRTVNGNTVRYVEYLSTTFLDQDVEDACFLDCSVSYSGSATSTITGLSHLQGETVECFGNGAATTVSGPVSGGSISLQDTVTAAVVGLPYESVIEFNQPAMNNAPAAMQGRLGRVHGVVLRLYRSFGGQIGISGQTLDIIPQYSSTTTMDGALELVSEDREFVLPSEFKYNPTVYLRHALPVPFTLNGIVYQITISSR